MVYFVRSAKVVPGEQGFEFAKAITKQINKDFPDLYFDLVTNISGELGWVHWLGKHESMAAAEKFRRDYSKSEGWQAVTNEWQEKREGPAFFSEMSDAFYSVAEILTLSGTTRGRILP